MKNSSSGKKRVLKRGRLNFKDGEDVKCVLHKFPYLESSDTLKINPKSKFLFYLLRITLQFLFIIYLLHKLFILHNIYFLFTLIIGLKHLNRTFSLFTSFKSFKSF